MPEVSIESIHPDQLSTEALRELVELHLKAYDRDRSVREQIIYHTKAWADPHRRRGIVEYLLREDQHIVACGYSFVRTIQTTQGPMDVLTLAGVGTHPDRRGKGYGARVVRCVFDRIDAGEAPFCLFQTGEARPFYEKLDARIVDNRFIDSTATARGEDPGVNPFVDDWVMVYPAKGPWPAGEIDLGGPGY
ncbi:MAG: GNAT family N-acetyltransferase [Planctomycetota bacterium]